MSRIHFVRVAPPATTIIQDTNMMLIITTVPPVATKITLPSMLIALKWSSLMEPKRTKKINNRNSPLLFSITIWLVFNWPPFFAAGDSLQNGSHLTSAHHHMHTHWTLTWLPIRVSISSLFAVTVAPDLNRFYGGHPLRMGYTMERLTSKRWPGPVYRLIQGEASRSYGQRHH